MKRIIKFVHYRMLAQIRKHVKETGEMRDYLQKKVKIAGQNVKSQEAINQAIYQKIKSGNPFFMGRFGGFELFAMRTYDFEIKSRYEKAINYMKFNAGFFSADEIEMNMFKDLMLKSIPQADVMGILLRPLEDYYLSEYGKNGLLTAFLYDIEPWSTPEKPWSAALKNKKVLVIHPFVETIQKQYQKREKLFPGTDILPEFELKTLKAVQTMAGEKDERFGTWFDALEWMYQEAMKVDFDVAIIGCGAYGYPLAARLKSMGKQAIHLGGPTQLLFGIKGKRWESDVRFKKVQKFFNEAWIYPSDSEKPKQADKIEGGCYW